MASKESRIHKFILRAWTDASELDLSAMERLGVKVKRAEYAAEGEGAVLALVQLDDKMRRSDIMKKLFGTSASGRFPYNEACAPDQAVLESRGVEILVASGETNAEFQRAFSAHFVASSGEEGKAKRAPPKAKEDGGGAVSSGMSEMLDRWGVEFLERAKRQRDVELAALREENERLRRAAAASVGEEEAKRLRGRLKELETVNAHLTEKKDSFDRLTLAYSEWCYNLKGKDERIAALEEDLASMTKCRDELAVRVGVQDKELAALRSRRFGAF